MLADGSSVGSGPSSSGASGVGWVATAGGASLRRVAHSTRPTATAHRTITAAARIGPRLHVPPRNNNTPPDAAPRGAPGAGGARAAGARGRGGGAAGGGRANAAR